MKKLLRVVHAFFLILWLILSTVFFSLTIYLFRPFSMRLAHWSAQMWVAFLILLSGVRITVTGKENLAPGRNYILMSNHLSAADIPLLYRALPLPFVYLAKRELFLIPFFGWSMLFVGHIPINRKSPRSAKRSLDKAVRVLGKGKSSLVVFPEGTRSPTGELGPFMLGVFSLAIAAQKETVPVAIQGSREILPKGSYLVQPHPVSVRIGKPIPTTGYARESKKELANRVREAMEELLRN